MTDPRLVDLRRALHRHPSLADDEGDTAARIRAFVAAFAPDEVLDRVGGHGLIALWRGAAPGPTVVVRCELDALPIPETIALPHGSGRPGVAHKCGHDGHMALVCGLAPRLRERPPAAGAVALLFQPAEETGQGAARVLADPRYAALAPEWCFALHNLPGFPLGAVIVRDGVFAAASRGLVVDLEGATAHAAEPQHGRSPALAVAALVQAFSALPQLATGLHEAAQVTVVHARVGELAFGTSPGVGRVAATLRACDDGVIDRLTERCVSLAQQTAAGWGLSVCERQVEAFPVTVNHPDAAAQVRAAAVAAGLRVVEPEHPFPWSEDVGHLTAATRGALVGLGAGEAHPALHHPTYDFPDALLPVGVALLEGLVRPLTGG